MKWLRLLLTTLIITENIATPIIYAKAQTATDTLITDPVVEITYTTTDKYTPEAKEYVGKVNAAATNGKVYDFYTLSGVVKTVKATEKGKDENNPDSKGYYQTGVGAPGYLVVAYDVINGNSLSYQDWIAATTTNENGKFAIPIEKTNAGVFLVVLKRENGKFRFITSYDVASTKTNRVTVYPENGINIGVIDIPEEVKDIKEYEKDIPGSIKIMDEEEYWACGEPSDISFKGEDANTQFTAKVKIEDDTYNGNQLSINKILDYVSGTTDTINTPTSPSVIYKGTSEGNVEGRTSFSTGENMGKTNSALSFFNGVMNRFLPLESNTTIPLCSEFLKSKMLDTSDPNKNYYTYNGMGALILPGIVTNQVAIQAIQSAVLSSTDACKDIDGTNKTYQDLLDEGYEAAVYQNFYRDKDFDKAFHASITKDYVKNDSIINTKGTAKEDTDPRTKPFVTEEELAITKDPDPRGDSPAMGKYTTMEPKANQTVKLFTKTFDEQAQGQLFNVPYQKVDNKETFIYELGPFRELCSISEVEIDGKKAIKNDEVKGTLKEDNRVTEGYFLSNKAIENYQDGKPVQIENLGNIKFFKDNLKGNVALQFLKNLITTFAGWISPKPGGLDSAGSCISVIGGDSPSDYKVVTKEECEESQKTVGKITCSKEKLANGMDEYRLYKNYEYTCTGKSTYPLEVVREQVSEGNTTIEGNPGDQGRLIKESFDLAGTSEKALNIGGGSIVIGRVTGADKSVHLQVKKDNGISTSTLDPTRFSMRIPDGTEGNVSEYNTTLVKLIDRTKNIGGGGSEYIYAGSGGSGNNTMGGGGVQINVDADCSAVSSMTSYKQCGQSWSENTWGIGGCTVCQMGCGPTSTAMVINSLAGVNINPGEIVSNSTYGYTDVLSCEGAYVADNATALQNAGLNAQVMGGCSAADMSSAICEGKKLIIVLGNACNTENCSSTIGHYIVVTGVKNANPDGFTVLDPYFNKTFQRFDGQPDGIGTLLPFNYGYDCIFVGN